MDQEVKRTKLDGKGRRQSSDTIVNEEVLVRYNDMVGELLSSSSRFCVWVPPKGPPAYVLCAGCSCFVRRGGVVRVRGWALRIGSGGVGIWIGGGCVGGRQGWPEVICT